MYGLLRDRDFPPIFITPPTSKTTVLGSSTASAAASEPVPDALRLVTLIIFPPLPPRVYAAQPSMS